MDIKEKNWQTLKQRYPQIYERLLALPAQSDYAIIMSSKEGIVPNMKNLKTGRLFYNPVNPMAEVHQDIKNRKLKVAQFNVFLGAGMLYHVFALYDLVKVQGGSHFIVEKNPDILRALMEVVDISAILTHPNVHFLVGEELPVIFTTINNVLTATDTKFYVKTVNFIEQAVAFSENKEYYLNVVRATKDAIKEVLNFFGNDPHDSMIGIENTLLNIDEILNNPGINQLKDAFKGRPGIVVATGPSLNKNVELLRDVLDKAVVVGADASLRVLAKRGMKPHMVCSLERLTPTSKLFEELLPEAFEDVYFAATPVIHPLTYQNYKGKRIVVYRNFATFKWLDIEKGILNIGPSSGNMAFKILEYLGCDPIILIGQDLAFGEDGNTHATGNAYGEKVEHTSYSESNHVMVEGNYSPQVRSSKVWNMFLNYYHKDVLNSQAKVINATEGGAKIHGTEIMTFKEAIGKYVTESFDPLATIKRTLTYPDGETLTAQRKQVLDKVDQGLMTCGKSIELFKGCHALCMEYIEKVWIPFSQGQPYNEAEGNRIVTELEQSVQIFRDPDFFNVLMHYVQSYAIKTMIEVHDITARDLPVHEIQVNVVSILKDMYEVMIQLIIKMEELLKVLKEKLEAELISG